MPYPYSNQNASGRAYGVNPDGSRGAWIEPGYVRTITDSRKNIYGVVHHPYHSRTEHVRAEEIYGNRHY